MGGRGDGYGAKIEIVFIICFRFSAKSFKHVIREAVDPGNLGNFFKVTQ